MPMRKLAPLLFLVLLACAIAKGLPLLCAILACLAFVLGWGLSLGHSMLELAAMAKKGIASAMGILGVFLLIGALTASWRISGTIPALILGGVGLIPEGSFYVSSFVLCAALSMLIGTSFGTCGTLGVVLMLLARTCGLDANLCAGAILSGIYVGDRASPVASSAVLVCAVSGQNLQAYLKDMLKSSCLPFALCCIIYLVPSLSLPALSASTPELDRLHEAFPPTLWALLPPLCIILPAILGKSTSFSLLAGTIPACLIALIGRHEALPDIALCLLCGYTPPTGCELLAGGGMWSMAVVGFNIMAAAACAGLAQGLGLLARLESLLQALALRFGASRTAILTSLPMAAVGCSQTLAVMLAAQLSRPFFTSRQALARALGNGAILTSVLIPWNVAGAVPVAILDVTPVALLYACYVWLLPLLSCLKREE